MPTGEEVPSKLRAYDRARAIATNRRALRIHVGSAPMHIIRAADLRVVDAERAGRALHHLHARSIFEKVWRQTGAAALRQFAQRIGLAGRTLYRVTDVELHNLVATAIERRELLFLHEEVMPPEEHVAQGASVEEAPAPRPAPRPAMPALAPAPAPAPVDVAAQIQTLIAAARDGVPFCEECARAARARQQAA